MARKLHAGRPGGSQRRGPEPTRAYPFALHHRPAGPALACKVAGSVLYIDVRSVPFKHVYTAPGPGQAPSRALVHPPSRFPPPENLRPSCVLPSANLRSCASSQSAFVRRNPYPTAIKLTQIMPEVGQLLYPNTRSRAKHIYTEEEVRVVS